MSATTLLSLTAAALAHWRSAAKADECVEGIQRLKVSGFHRMTFNLSKA